MRLRPLILPLIVPAIAVLLSACDRPVVLSGKQEARGVWMSRFEYATEAARKDPEVARKRIRDVFDKARAARMNMIFFQVRGNGDAFYRSKHEPWSNLLTGTLGKDPGWDPLAFALQEARARGLELHAWINVFPVWRDSVPPPMTVPPNPLAAHPEWLVCDRDGRPMRLDPPNNNYLWASPGIPAVRSHVLSIVEDIVRSYDVDGVHFDYIRYPEGSPEHGYSHDTVSVRRFRDSTQNPFRLPWNHWQREQVSEFVFEAYNRATGLKPWVKMSAAVIGKYMGTGWTSYSAVYQDPRRWMEVGKIDFIVPMVYWERTHPTHPFLPLVDQWIDRAAYDRHIVPGLASRMLTRVGWSELKTQVEEVRKRKMPGVVYFSAAGLEQVWDRLGGEVYLTWANVPAMPWKSAEQPGAVSGAAVRPDPRGYALTWSAPSTDASLSYNVYRNHGGRPSAADPVHILTVTPRGSTSYTDTTANGDGWQYAVSAVNRYGHEGPLVHLAPMTPR